MEHADVVFGGEREEWNERDAISMKPVAVSCLKCGAPLAVSAETLFNAQCGFCNTAQCLPDALWLSFHPVKKRRTWYVRFKF